MKKKWPLILPLGTDVMNPGMIVTDPFGSYTGRPMDPEETPVQDADDL